MDQERIDKMMGNQKKQMEQAQMMMQMLTQQRKGGLQNLEKKVQNLLDDVGKFNKDSLEGDDGSAVLVSALRDITQGLNSVQLILESHDQLTDMLINDLSGVVDKVNSSMQGLMQTSAMTEACLRVLMDKGVLTEEEVKSKFKVLVTEANESAQKLKEQAQEEPLVKL